MMSYYTFEKLKKIFSSNISKTAFYAMADRGEIPSPIEQARGTLKARVWKSSDLPEIGKRIGFLSEKSGGPLLSGMPCGVITSYARKGGVLKSSMAFNVARTAALHGLKTCIVGLDSQCDITRMLGHYSDVEDLETLEEVTAALERKKGLFDLYSGSVGLEQIIHSTDLPTLFYIPETDNIEFLADALETANRREFWLEENVISRLRGSFDVIVLDCSPTSGRLIANSIYSTDLILSPVECSVNNWRNFKGFEAYLNRTLESLRKPYTDVVFIPTKRKKTNLSKDIYDWYIKNVPNTPNFPIPQSSQMEDSIFMGLSVFEHCPKDPVSMNMKEVVQYVFKALEKSVAVGIKARRLHLENEIRATNGFSNEREASL